jgi:hypothetical protein
MAEEEEKEEYFPTESLPQETSEDIWYRTEMFKVLEKIIEDKEVEQKLQDMPFWSIGSKTLKLTFFDESEANSLINLFEAEVCRYLRSLPPNKQDFNTYLKLGQARIIFLANINRSVGTPIQKINERIAILSQWKITTPVEVSPQPKPSIWQRIFGR